MARTRQVRVVTVSQFPGWRLPLLGFSELAKCPVPMCTSPVVVAVEVEPMSPVPAASGVEQLVASVLVERVSVKTARQRRVEEAAAVLAAVARASLLAAQADRVSSFFVTKLTPTTFRPAPR